MGFPIMKGLWIKYTHLWVSNQERFMAKVYTFMDFQGRVVIRCTHLWASIQEMFIDKVYNFVGFLIKKGFMEKLYKLIGFELLMCELDNVFMLMGVKPEKLRSFFFIFHL